MTRQVVAMAAIAVVLLTGCAAGNHVDGTILTTPQEAQLPNTSPSPTPAEQASATPPPTAKPTATAAATPTAPATATDEVQWTEVEPSAVIEISDATGFIPAITDGTTVWAASRNVLLRVDAATNTVERLDAPLMTDDTTFALADDGLWATRWAGDKLYRLDPQTGAVQVDADMPAAVRIAFVGEDMWVGREDVHSMFKVDRATGEADPATQLTHGAYGVAGLGDLWFVGGPKVLRVDPESRALKASFEFPAESNCGIYGTFPNSVWTSCFERAVRERSVARIDPETNSIAAVAKLPPSHGGSVVTVGDHTWFVGTCEGPDGTFAGLVRIDPATGATDRFFSIAGVDPDGSLVAGDALWIADEAGRRLVKVDLAALE